MKWSLIKEKLAISQIKLLLILVLQHGVKFIIRRPWLKRLAHQVGGYFPKLQQRLINRLLYDSSKPISENNKAIEFQLLTEDARKIYSKLQLAIDENKNIHLCE